MTRHFPRSRALALVVVLAFALGACGGGGQPAAEVDGQEISVARLEADVQMFEFITSLSGSPCGQPIEGETQGSACARLTLTNLIQEDLVKTYAAEHDLVTDPQTVTDTISQIEAAVGGAEALDAQLAERDLTRAALVALAERLLLFNSVQDAVASDTLTDERVQELYEENRSQYTTLEISHILVQTKTEAEEIAAEVTPKNFAEIATERSRDGGSAPNGGSLGVIVEAAFVMQYDPSFVAATLAMQPGEISEPAQSQFGWHVIYFVDRQVTPLEDVREQIVAAGATEAFTTWLQDALRAAEIRVNPRYGVLDQATGQVTPVRSTNTDSPFEPTGAPSPTP